MPRRYNKKRSKVTNKTLSLLLILCLVLSGIISSGRAYAEDFEEAQELEYAQMDEDVSFVEEVFEAPEEQYVAEEVFEEQSFIEEIEEQTIEQGGEESTVEENIPQQQEEYVNTQEEQYQSGENTNLTQEDTYQQTPYESKTQEAEEDLEEALEEDLEEELEEDLEEELKEEEIEEEILMPAQSFYGSANGLNVSAYAQEGVFPEGTSMNVAPVSARYIINAADEITGDKEEVVDAVAVDITFYDKEGREIQPQDGSVRVRLYTSNAVDGQNHELIHVDDSGNAHSIGSASATSASFNADHFSIYAIIGTDTEETKYARITYHFFVDGEELNSFCQIVRNGDTLIEPDEPVSANGGKFIGWYDKDGNKFDDFDTPVSFDEESKTADEEVRLYAKFENKYAVIFRRKDDIVLKTVIGDAGTSVTTDDVTYEVGGNQVVTGWTSVKDDSASKVGDTVTIPNDSDLELWPIIEDIVWVTFDTGEGSRVESQYVLPGNTITKPADPAKIGFDFIGWYMDDTYAAEFDFDNPINEDTTLYAKWNGQEVSYKVAVYTENADDDNYTLYDVLERTGKAGTELTTNLFTNIVPTDGAIRAFTINNEMSNEKVCILSGDGTTVREVYFKRIHYTVGFYSYDGTELWFTIDNVKHNENFYDRYIEAWQNSEHYTDTDGNGWTRRYVGDNLFLADQQLSADQSLRIGGLNSLTSIRLDANGYARFLRSKSNVFTFYERLYYEVLDDETTPDGAIIVEYPEGSGKQYYLGLDYSFVHMNGSRNMYFAKNQYILIAAIVDSTGESLEIDDTAPNNRHFIIRRNQLTNLYFDRLSYTLSFNEPGVDSAEVIFEGKIEQYEPSIYQVGDTKNIDDKIYVFQGWEDAEGNLFDFSTARMPGNDVILFAKWMPVEITVSFNTQGGSEVASATVNSGETVVKPADPTKIVDGVTYTFAGWTLNGEPFDFGTKLYEDTTLIASWMNLETGYKVVYDAGDGQDEPTDDNAYQHGAAVRIAGAPVAPGSMVFEGWKLNGEGTLYKPTDVYSVDSADAYGDTITFVASYKDATQLLTTQITYDPNGGEGTSWTYAGLVNNGTYTVLSVSDNNLDYSKMGYTFAYWNTQADGRGASYYEGQKIAVSYSEPLPNYLYAVWEKRTDLSYTVKYVDKETEEEIATPSTGTATFKEEITAESQKKDIDGYEYDSAEPETLVIGTDEDENVITLYYTMMTDIGYTVKYVDKETEEEIDTSTGTATFKEEITAESQKKDIDGYEYDSADPDTLVIRTNEDENVMILYYTRMTDIGYTVKYVDKETEEEIDTSTGTATFKEEITAESQKKDIPGYEYDSAEPETLTIGTDENANVMILYYTKNDQATYTVTYVVQIDGTGTVSPESETEWIWSNENLNGSVANPASGHHFDGWYDENGNKIGFTEELLREDIISYLNKVNDHYADTIFFAKFVSEIQVTKVWNDQVGDRDYSGYRRPVTVYVVPEGGQTYGIMRDPYELSENNNWTDVVTHLPFIDDDGEEIIYTVEEDMVYSSNGAPLYTVEVSGSQTTGFIVTNTINVLDIQAPTVSKIYDGQNIYETHKDELKTGTEAVDSLGKLRDGDTIVFDIPSDASEIDVVSKPYTPSKEQVRIMRGNEDVTNEYNIGTIFAGEISITKRSVILVSDDLEKYYDGKPLVNGSAPLKTEEGFVEGEGVNLNFTGSQTEVGASDNLFTFEAKDGTNLDNYDIMVYFGTLNVTDRVNHEPETITISGVKTWNDENDKDGIRPVSIVIRLYADEAEVKYVVVDKSSDWKYEFTSLPKYNDEGKEITYTIKEDKVNGYETKISGFNVTNTHIPKKDEPKKPDPKPPVVPTPPTPVSPVITAPTSSVPGVVNPMTYNVRTGGASSYGVRDYQTGDRSMVKEIIIMLVCMAVIVVLLKSEIKRKVIK